MSRVRLAAAAFGALASAVLYSVCFPPANLAFLAWVALVPLLVAIRRTPLAGALILTWAFTVATAYATGDWFPRAVSVYYNQSALVGIGFFLAVSSFMAGPGTIAFALCYRVLARRRGPALPLLAGAAWVTGEIVRARLAGNPWVLLGYSQVDVTALVQIGDLTGVYGVGFVVASVNAALAELWLAWRDGRPLRPAVLGVAVAGGIVVLTLAYGVARLSAGIPESGGDEPVKVAVVQGNLDLGSQWRPEFYGENLRTYLQLTLQALHDGRPALVIWPENAMSFFLDDEPLYRSAIAEVLSAGQVQLVAGGPRVVGEADRRYFNSAFLLAPDGTTLGLYDKQRLLPFAEYFPFPSFDFLHRNFGRVREFTAGAPGPALLPTIAGAAGVAICNEAMYPEIVAEHARAGAEYLINLSNDSWIPDATFSEITFNKVRFRAIEQRRYLVRASTSGPSAIVDPFGRVLARGGVLSRGVIAGTVRPQHTRTLYGRAGDAFAALCAASVMAGMILPSRRRPALAA